MSELEKACAELSFREYESINLYICIKAEKRVWEQPILPVEMIKDIYAKV